MAHQAINTVTASDREHQGGLVTKPKHLLVLSHSSRLLEQTTKEYSAEHKKQRGWTVTGAIVDVPENCIDQATRRIKPNYAGLYGTDRVVNTAEDLKALLHDVKPNAILAHEYAIRHPDHGMFCEFEAIAQEARRIMPGVPYAVECERYSRLEHHWDDGKQPTVLHPGHDGFSDSVIEHHGLAYGTSSRSLHAYLKAGVDARRGKEIAIN